MDDIICTGDATKESPLRYEVNDALIEAVRTGRWNTGMLHALADEVDRLRIEIKNLRKTA